MSSEHIPLNRVPSLQESIFTYPDILKLRASVIPAILPRVILITLYTSILSYLHVALDWKLYLPNTVVASLSVVVGLLLVFRTNTAYDRYYEGRRLWSTLKTDVRNLTRLIWIYIPEENTQDIYEKRQALKYVVSYATAVKHYLRGEYGAHYDDLVDLLPKDFHFATPNISIVSPTSFLDTSAFQSYQNEGSARSESTTPIQQKFNFKNAELNLPLEISFRISIYMKDRFSHCGMGQSIKNQLQSILCNMVDCLGQFERIIRTPIPLAYNIHLKQTLFLYCLILPFTLLDLGYLTIVVIAMISFMLFGIEGIGYEIENPFGYDPNDLPLDLICEELTHEMLFIIKKIHY